MVHCDFYFLHYTNTLTYLFKCVSDRMHKKTVEMWSYSYLFQSVIRFHT